MKLQPLQLYQGDDFSLAITLPEYTDLNGYTAQAQIRTGFADDAPGPPAATLVPTITPNAPTITITLPSFMSKHLAGSYKWDLQLISPTGLITTVVYGPVKVLQEVTR